MIAVPWWLLGLLVAAVAVLLLLFWSVKHRRRPKLELAAQPGLDELERSIAGLTQGTLCSGNRIELVQNGEFFSRVTADVEAAERTVHVETFLAKEGEVTRCLAEVLARRAREGLKVRVMLDSNGGKTFGKRHLERMREAGVRVAFYHPWRLSTLGRINNRDHRKIVVVDGRIAYVGGHCLVDSWMGRAEDCEHFRDISARAEGPVVAQLQAAFSENWIEETGEVLAGEGCFPALAEVGEAKAHAVWLSPAGSPSSVELLHFLAIRAAQRSITIQNPYFLPDPEELKALVAAARRGVRVRVMIPATTASDAPFVQHASHHRYGFLLEGGVELYDYQRTLLHQKVMTVDGRWSSVGSANFDDRSFEINDEVTLAVCDEALAEELEAIFEADLEHAKRVELAAWKKRKLGHRLVDFGAFLVNEQL
jgi:cardiolipin synthase